MKIFSIQILSLLIYGVSCFQGFNYSQPPPNCVYAQQIPVTPYGMMASYVGGPQMMYATYHVVPAQNDCQNYYVMVRLYCGSIQSQDLIGNRGS